MPPETPRVSTGIWRGVLLFISGVVLGALVGVPAFIFFLRSDAGTSIITKYLTVPPPLPDMTIEQSATSTQLIQQFASGTAGIPVPRGVASQAYTDALNASVRDITLIAASSTQLSAVLTQIDNQSIARNYDGILNLVFQAKGMIAVQSTRVAQFGRDLAALSAANQTTPDAVTKATTLDLVAKGTVLQTGLQTYTASLDALLSGAPPTQAQLDSIKNQSSALEAQAGDFIAALKALEQHFGLSSQGQ